jgi:hypothetical protein
MSDVPGGSKVKDPEDAVFPVSEMVARVLRALQTGGEGESAPDSGTLDLRRALSKLTKHLTHSDDKGALPLCRLNPPKVRADLNAFVGSADDKPEKGDAPFAHHLY